MLRDPRKTEKASLSQLPGDFETDAFVGTGNQRRFLRCALHTTNPFCADLSASISES